MDFGGQNSALRQKPTPEVLPASQYLQDRLLERRARNTRPKRTRRSDFGPRMASGFDDDLFFAEAEDSRHASNRPYDSSPLAPLSKYGSEANGNGAGTLSAGGRKRRTPGARELDEQMDRLTKQNFDLKLEIDHRRESQAKLQEQLNSMRAQVERAARLEDEHTELMRINSLLVEELEKRDKAIQEAADIICNLEEKVDEYEERRVLGTRPSTAIADSGYAGTETHEQVPPSSPPEILLSAQDTRNASAATAEASMGLNGTCQTQTPARPRREPAFLTDQKPSTNALRSVYLDAGKDLHPVKSFNSILSKRTSTIDEEALAQEVLNSPRLSALSESSFPSIYGKNGGTPEKREWESQQMLPEGEISYGSSHIRQDSISRVNQWIEDRQNMADTPSKSNRISSPLSSATIMNSPRLSRKSAEGSNQSLSSAAASARPTQVGTPASVKPFPMLGKRTRQAPRTPAAVGTTPFEEQLLPPTPDSASARMLRTSRSSTNGERSILDCTPAQVKGFAPLQPIPSSRSNMELDDAYAGTVNARADGLGVAAADLQQASFVNDESETEYEDYDAHASSEDGHDWDYDGYPDGNSITNGTPSRFTKYSTHPSSVTDMFFSRSEVSPPERHTPGDRPPQRRNSSSEVYSSSPYVKPSYFRADTSPTVFGSMANQRLEPRPATSGHSQAHYTYESDYSGTPLATQERHPRTKSRSWSPEPASPLPRHLANTTAATPSPPRFTSQRSPAPTSASRSSFTQKTQNLFRRMSNSTTNDDPRPPRREREKSPLPTLTSTPASAYQMRRPSTSAAMMTPIHRPGSAAPPSRAASRDRSGASRPGISPRTMTEPSLSPGAMANASVVSVPEAPVQKRGLFRRGGSLKQQDQLSLLDDGGGKRRSGIGFIRR